MSNIVEKSNVEDLIELIENYLNIPNSKDSLSQEDEIGGFGQRVANESLDLLDEMLSK